MIKPHKKGMKTRGLKFPRGSERIRQPVIRHVCCRYSYFLNAIHTSFSTDPFARNVRSTYSNVINEIR